MSYKNAISVTPNDTSDLTGGSCDALLIGSAGNIVITPVSKEDGDNVTLTGLQAGQEIKIQVKRVWSTNTTAGDIVALYGGDY